MNQKQRPPIESTKLSIRTKARLTLIAIIVLALFFGLIAWPSVPDAVPGSSFFKKFYLHLGLDLKGGTHLIYEADLSQIPSEDKKSALEGVRDVIERRVNTLGVAEPIVQTTKTGSSLRVIVELAGITDVNEAIRMIGETPLLEFKELTPESPGTPDTESISQIETKNREKEQLAQEIIAKLQAGESFEDLAKQYSEDEATKEQGGDLGWVGKGVFIPPFEEAIFNEMKPGEIRSEPLLTEFGYHVIKKIEERTNEAGEQEIHAAHILFKTESVGDQQPQWLNTKLSGKQLKRSQVTFDPQTNQPQISLSFNSEGAELFREITERNVGKPVAIFLDGVIISSPVVQSIISGGQAVITGNFTLTEAKTLAQRLNAGALPVPVTLLSQQTIGATLGSESLQKSLSAAYIGFAAVALFMVAYYLLPGFLSVIALSIYAVIALGLFELIPITLTLAGIAGFILSIGMAVDANILIFERMKEELRQGLPFKEAVESGFKRAWPSIRDSNISSLITCVILYWFGSSIIRGFAITLGVGILVSMFSAITVTRTFLRLIIELRFCQYHQLFGVRKKQDHA